MNCRCLEAYVNVHAPCDHLLIIANLDRESGFNLETRSVRVLGDSNSIA